MLHVSCTHKKLRISAPLGSKGREQSLPRFGSHLSLSPTPLFSSLKFISNVLSPIRFRNSNSYDECIRRGVVVVFLRVLLSGRTVLSSIGGGLRGMRETERVWVQFEI
jgi:hypothetical protein